jgi:hypothetical protein
MNIMKLVSILAVSSLTLLPISPGLAQDLRVGSDDNRIMVPPKTKRERDLGLEGKPPGQIEQPAPDDENNMTDEPDENLDDERLPPTPPSGRR